MQEGKTLRDQALDRLAASAPAFIDLIVAAIRMAPIGRRFSTDQLWCYAEASGIRTPHEPRAMGAAITRAAKLGLIKRTGSWVTSSRPECHARPVAEWVRV